VRGEQSLPVGVVKERVHKYIKINKYLYIIYMLSIHIYIHLSIHIYIHIHEPYQHVLGEQSLSVGVVAERVHKYIKNKKKIKKKYLYIIYMYPRGYINSGEPLDVSIHISIHLSIHTYIHIHEPYQLVRGMESLQVRVVAERIHFEC